MSNELTIAASLETRASGADIATGKFSVKRNVSGSNATQGIQTISTETTLLEKGDVGTIGFLFIRNLTVRPVPTMSDVIVTHGGTPGSTSYTYQVVAFDIFGGYSAPASVTTATGNATLDGTNYNILTWTAVDNAASYAIYRTASAGTPSSVGILDTLTSPSFLTYSDQGASASAGTAATNGAAGTAFVSIGPTITDYLCRLDSGDLMLVRWNAAAVHCISEQGGGCVVDYLMVED
jgi:hypothetical protein